MTPEKQIEMLNETMKILNKGNATHDEVVQLFATLSKAIKEIRENLEKQIKELGSKSTESEKNSVISLKAVEARISDSVKKTGDTSTIGIKELQKAFKAEIEAVKALIPEIPEFPDVKAMIAEIPPAPFLTSVEIRDRLEILKGDERLENYAVKDVPRITVSVSPPDNPQRLDLWVKL